MAYGHNTKAGAMAEVANRFFDRMIYLRIKNDGISMADIEKSASLFIIGNNPGISAEGLIQTQTRTTPRTMLDYQTGFIMRGLGELKSLGLVEQQDMKLSLTELGREFRSFLRDKDAVELWLGSIEYPEGSDAAQIKSNMTKLKEFIEVVEDFTDARLKGSRRSD
ncbi:MAG: hypothetical protein ACYCO0_00495 [Candidatus Micrarchaeaceae archaeon]